MTITADPANAWQHLLDDLNPQRRRRWATPGDLATHLDPRTVQTSALDLIDAELARLTDTPDGRLIISMPPQEGKSTRVAKDGVIWALTQNPDRRIVVGSYAQHLANRNGRVVRNTITAHPDLGIRIADDHGAASEWSLAGHDGGVRAVGRGAGITGFPADMLVIDDPLKDRNEADSATIRDTCWDWWTDSLSTRLAPGAPVVLILTRWHEDDLAGRLLAAEDGHLWRVINIPAQADHRPEQGETDVLGRDPGEFMDSARGRTREQWEAIRVRVGSRTWASLYQGRPTPVEGGIVDRTWWDGADDERRYHQPVWLDRDDGTRVVTDPDAELIVSWDLAFKDTTSSDFVCGQVWMRRGVDCYLLDQVHGRYDFVASCQQVRALAARWPQALLHVVEDKANGPAVIASLRRIVAGIVPDEPQGSKQARLSAVSPLIEAGNVHLPTVELAPWVAGLVEEVAAFPNGSHDDRVDAMSQALNRLVLRPLLAGTLTVTSDDFDDDYDISEI